jgi:hypothetical protein
MKTSPSHRKLIRNRSPYTRRCGLSTQYGGLPPDLVSELQRLRNRKIKIRRSNGDIEDHWKFTDEVDENTTEIHLEKIDRQSVFTKTLRAGDFAGLIRLNLPGTKQHIAKSELLPGTKPSITQTAPPGTKQSAHAKTEFHGTKPPIAKEEFSAHDIQKIQQLRDEFDDADARLQQRIAEMPRIGWGVYDQQYDLLRLRAMYLKEQLWLAYWSADLGRLREFWQQQQLDYQQLPQVFSLARLQRMREVVLQNYDDKTSDDWDIIYPRMQLFCALNVASRGLYGGYEFLKGKEHQNLSLMLVIPTSNHNQSKADARSPDISFQSLGSSFGKRR